MYINKILPFAVNKFSGNRKSPVCRLATEPYANDVFIKSANINFTSTSAGTPLKRLRNITDPYSGIKMLSGSEMSKIESDIPKQTTVKKAVKYLRKYKKNMQKVEREIFNDFEAAAADNPRTEFQELLKQWYDGALINLKLEELSVFDSMDNMTKDLSPQTALNVKEKLTYCRKMVFGENGFKRKDIISVFDNIESLDSEKDLIKDIQETSYFLPTSNTSKNAFIVKYAERKHDEIAKRLVRSSMQTIEHIHPDSAGGENNISNFMLASASVNSLRGNMPFAKFIKRYPAAITNCQKYIEDIIDAIHRGGLRGNEAYPYKLQETLRVESDNAIQLDLSSFKISKAKAQRMERKHHLRR